MDSNLNHAHIETDRLLLRALHRWDAEALFRYAKDPMVGPAAGWAPHRNLRDSRAAIRAMRATGRVLGVVKKETGELIGTIGLRRDDHRPVIHCAALGYSFAPKEWGKGYATEACRAILGYAFGEMLLPFCSAVCLPENKASIALLTRLGFSYDGVLRHGYLSYDGTVRDILIFSLTREAFLEKTAQE